jgi:hypothetical protein
MSGNEPAAGPVSADHVGRRLASPDTHVMVLPDERELAWMELGAPQGLPVIAFHGTPGRGCSSVSATRRHAPRACG